MENFITICNDFKPNITYLAIGSAYSIQGGPQQHPPFMEKLMLYHPEFSFEIILLDPLLENPPEITTYYKLKMFDSDWFGNENLSVHIIKESFSFQNILENIADTTHSKKLLTTLIDRIINSKNENPTETYLLFVHDFSGNHISKLSDICWTWYHSTSPDIQHLYQKNILIDVNNKINTGCFVDMNSIYFFPKLIKNSLGALEIFNPFTLNDFDIYKTMIQKKYNNTKIKKLLLLSITQKLNSFSNEILPLYRQIIIALQNKNFNLNNFVDSIESKVMFNGIIFNSNKNTQELIKIITNNMLEYLKLIIRLCINLE